jgi:hypothetical protein
MSSYLKRLKSTQTSATCHFGQEIADPADRGLHFDGNAKGYYAPVDLTIQQSDGHTHGTESVG